jgi:hypothetical protein
VTAARATWLNRTGFLLIWIMVTAGVSFLVARNASGDDGGVDVTAPLPPLEISQRATVSLTETTVVPVVSADATVINLDGVWLLGAPAPTDDLAYRLLDPPVGVKAKINGGPSGFECAWVGLGQADASELLSESAREVAPTTTGVTMRCQIPDDVRVVAGMSGLMVLQLGEPATVSSLPVTAVVGAAGQGQVVVVLEDGSTEIRTVMLGVSDVYNIEITGGLEPGEVVLQTPVQADFAKAATGP